MKAGKVEQYFYDEFPCLRKILKPSQISNAQVRRWTIDLLSRNLAQEILFEETMQTGLTRHSCVALFDVKGNLISTVAKPVWYRPSTWSGPDDLSTETVGAELERLGRDKRQRVSVAIMYDPDGNVTIYKPPKTGSIESLFFEWKQDRDHAEIVRLKAAREHVSQV